ncbi:MAG TPA: PfkB family carbohydrate kinase [Thermoleophilaceae bacterium]|nr:PfkB family carbohydrate kinase [Thermoleophilaceae bacterium]
MRAAVVGHVEWIEFAAVERMPAAGDIVHAGDVWQEPGGGGAVAAVQLAKLAGGATLYTALGDDEFGHRAHDELRALGLRVEAVFRPEPQRRGFVHVDANGERTITVIGERLGPRAEDPLPWSELRDTDAVYLTAGDARAVRAAREAGVLVSTPRGIEALAEAGVELDALVASGADRGERYEPGQLEPPPRVVVRTAGPAGGAWETATESGGYDAAPLPGPARDAYGCGDSFAAGLTYGLGSGLDLPAALELAARCGAACLTGRGPYEGQLASAR